VSRGDASRGGGANVGASGGSPTREKVFRHEAHRLLTPIAFQAPTHLTDIVSWHGQVPFAFWCIDVMRPRVFIELGTHKGDSYASFCQAVKELCLPTRCYAVDTWKGDEHAGLYDEEVFRVFEAQNAESYGAFSRLVRSTFDDAVGYFQDGSIDLLHIDGLHRYEAVKHDFESWLPKLSSSAVVLFHDVNVREREFGVWRLWGELCDRYPHFEFLHSHGLGVLAVGEHVAPAIKRLCGLGDKETEQVRTIFARLGRTVSLTSERSALMLQTATLETAVAERESRRATLEAELAAVKNALGSRDGQLATLENELEVSRASREEGERHAGQLQGELQIAQTRLAEAQAMARDLQTALEAARASRHEEEQRAGQLQAQLEAASESLGHQHARETTLQGELQIAQTRLAEAQAMARDLQTART
jgi:Methyltransferase domain